MLESQTKEFLRSCRFNASDPDNKYCPIFRLNTIVEEAGADYDKLALKVRLGSYAFFRMHILYSFI